MRILIDIKHPAQLNLFKVLAKEMRDAGWDVTISYLGRGKLPQIINREYSGFNVMQIGKSEGTKWSIFWDGNVTRTRRFIKLIKQYKYNICIAASSIPLALACYATRTPVIQFYDDPERKMVNRTNAFFSTKIFFPPIVRSSKKVGIFNCLKEWSYLSPKRFAASKDILNEYNLEAHNYIFVREVSNKSFNYFGQQDGIIASFSKELTENIKVVLSLEDKTLVDRYPADWIVLNEPVSDIHSLMYYSKLVLSSGDSMAREGAMLGVPAIYCGIREMKANALLIEKGILLHKPLHAAVESANDFILKPFNATQQEDVRNKLAAAWVDMIDFMKAQIDFYKIKSK